MILLTGFAPYREAFNASAELVNSFNTDLPRELAHWQDKLACEIIACDDTSRETEHRSLEKNLKALLERYNPELCIHTGQAPSVNRITIEKIATNSFMHETIDRSRPVAYWSNLPGTDSLLSVLQGGDVPAGFSSDAGQHLCNHILFSSRFFAENNRCRHRSGFIHIPLLPEQVRAHPEVTAMPLKTTRKALSLIINHVAETHYQDRKT
jgi:pyroglutamyl-peptidase